MEEELPGGWSLGWRNRLDCPKGLDWALVPGWAELHRRWKLVGQLGKTARNNRKCSALWPRCWTGTLRMMAWRRRHCESGQMTRPSVCWLKPGVLEWEVLCCYSWMRKFHTGVKWWTGRMFREGQSPMSGKSLFITHEHEAEGSVGPDQHSEHLQVWYLAQGHLDSAPQLSCNLSCLWPSFVRVLMRL